MIMVKLNFITVTIIRYLTERSITFTTNRNVLIGFVIDYNGTVVVFFALAVVGKLILAILFIRYMLLFDCNCDIIILNRCILTY